MEVTELGMVTEVNFEQLLNAYKLMEETEDGMTTEVKR